MTCIGTFEDDYPGSKYVLSLFSVMVYIPMGYTFRVKNLVVSVGCLVGGDLQ